MHFRNCFSFKVSASPLNGFTLAELLVSMAVIAIIATFAITKILQSEQDARKRAIFKEDLSILTEQLYESWQSGEISNGQWLSQWMGSRNINYVKFCPNGNWAAAGCSSLYGGAPVPQFSLWVLPNGSYIESSGGDTQMSCVNSDCAYQFMIDWNGDLGPNFKNQDQDYVFFCVNKNLDTPCTNAVIRDKTTGFQVSPHIFNGASLYDWIYAN